MNTPEWFSDQSVTEPLEQGTIISDFEWFNFEKLTSLRTDDGSASEFATIKNHVIILTQSCDLRKSSTKFIHVCPVYTLTDYLDDQNARKDDSKRTLFDRLSKNSNWSKHLLNTFNLDSLPAFKNDYLVVDFAKAFIVPMSYVKNVMSKQDTSFPLLNIPYRESMAQRYGQYFARVGNPLDLDDFEKSKHVNLATNPSSQPSK